MTNTKKLAVIYVEPNGLVQPISIQFSHFFIGVDCIAVFSSEKAVQSAIKQVKAEKSRWNTINKNGKFVILNLDKQHNFPIKINLTKVKNNRGVSHSHTGQIWRCDIKEINNMSVNDWYEHLKSKKQISIH